MALPKAVQFTHNSMEVFPVNPRHLVLGAAIGVLLSATGCASTPDGAKPVSTDETTAVHEYRTGSLMAQKEKHVTTDEERQQAEDIANKARSSPTWGKVGN